MLQSWQYQFFLNHENWVSDNFLVGEFVNEDLNTLWEK